MDTITLLRRQLARAHTIVNDPLADATPEQAHWPPPGRAHPIGALVMHLARSEDGIVNRMIAGRPTLLETTYAGKTGVSTLPPMGPDWGDWARSVQVDLPVLLAYY